MCFFLGQPTTPTRTPSTPPLPLPLQQRQSRLVDLAFPEPLCARCACAVAAVQEKLDVLAAVVFAGGAVRPWRVAAAASFSVPPSSSTVVVRLGFGAIDPPAGPAFLPGGGTVLAISEAQVRAVSREGGGEEDAAWAARHIPGASQGCAAVLDDVLVLGDGGRVVVAVPPGREDGPGSEGLPSSLPLLASAGEEAAVALGAFRGAGAGSPPLVRGGVCARVAVGRGAAAGV